jgi:4-hydroxy-tetrahydrodipicolinate reductase
MLAALAEAAGKGSFPITSVRTGSVPGTHEVIFDAPFEQVRLVHEARDRSVFAVGALAAARWLAAENRVGVFTLDDILGGAP